MEETKRSFRLPTELLDQLAELARRNDRSVNRELIRAIRRHLEAEEGLAARQRALVDRQRRQGHEEEEP